MGWINYVNLTFSRILKRVKELATRKTFGAGYIDFMVQFLFETLLLNACALVVAAIFIWSSHGLLESITHIPLAGLPDLKTTTVYLTIIGSGSVFIAIYPSLVASTFNANVLFKTNSKAPGMGRSFLKGVTVFQYAVSIIMILWVFIMNLQMNHLLTIDTGLNKEHVVIIDGPLFNSVNYSTEVASLGNELKRMEGITGFTSSNSIPGDQVYKMVLIKPYGRETNAGLLTNGGVDEDFIPFYKIKLLGGRNFYKDTPSEINSILISAAGMKRLGWTMPEEAIGQYVVLDNWNNPLNDGGKMEVIGVFEDYSLYPYFKTGSSSQDETGSEGLFLTYKSLAIPFLTPNKIAIRTQGNFGEVMTRVKETYTTIFPQSFFNWYFLEEHMNKSYQSHLNFKSQIMIFTALAVFIACLGLLGSTSFTVIEKLKELAVRKVLGANSGNLLRVLLQSTTKQILISLGVGLPLGYYFVTQYLNGYTSRVEVLWWYFIIPLIILSLIFLLTLAPILYRSIKTDPAKALKNN